MLTDRDTNPLCGARFIHSKAEAPPVVKGPVHRDDPCLERIDALLAPPEEAPVGELLHLRRVHVRQFVQVPLAHGDVVVDGPLQPPRPLTIPIVVDAVEDRLAAGVQGLGRDEQPREVLLPPRALATTTNRGRRELQADLRVLLLIRGRKRRGRNQGLCQCYLKVPARHSAQQLGSKAPYCPFTAQLVSAGSVVQPLALLEIQPGDERRLWAGPIPP